MSEMIAFCGLNCNECPAFLATQENDDEKRKHVAEQWSKQYQASFKPSDINCDGCSRDGRLFSYCSICNIRQCGREKNLENCAGCDDYPCKKLEDLFEMAPQAKANLDRIKVIG